jgi:arabinogalactan oligomer / maltooligosaccharide transport system substrate-binding protein
MKLNKKMLFNIVSVFIIALLLGACGPQKSSTTESDNKDNKKPTKLVIWEDLEKSKGIQSAIEHFEKEKGIEIEVSEKAFASQIEALRLDGPAGNGPDIFTIPDSQLAAATTEGLLAEIKMNDEVESRFTEGSLKASKVDGKYYAIPKATDSTIIFYNKALLKEEDIPKTITEWYDYSKSIVDQGQGKYGLLALFDAIYYAQSILGGYGSYIFGENKDGSWNPDDIGLNNKGALEGAKIIEKFYHDGVLPAGIIGENGIQTLDSLFTEGKAAAVISGAWNFEPYESAGIDYGVIPLPKLDNGEQMKSFNTTKLYNISSYSKNKELAQEFLEYITQYEQAKERFNITQEIPPIIELLEDPEIASNERIGAIAEQSKYSISNPNIAEMNEVWLPMDGALQLIATGDQSPKEAFDYAVETIKAQIATNHSGK